METVKSELLKKILSEGRAGFNKSFIIAKHYNIRLDGDLFLNLIAKIMDPLMENFKNSEYKKVYALSEKLYSQLLELFSREILGKEGKYPGFEDFFLQGLSRYSSLLLEEPDLFVPALTNSYLNFSAHNPEKAESWGKTLLELSTSLKTINEFKNSGVVLAWINGMAGYRNASLDILSKMDIKLISAVFGNTIQGLTQDNKTAWLNKVSSNPWINPSNALLENQKPEFVFKTAGAFTGFDGQFISPPMVFLSEGGFIATDEKNSYQLYSDYFGIHLSRIKEDLKEMENDKNSGWEFSDNENLKKGTQSFPIVRILRLPVSFTAFDKNTFCFTSSLSHKIFIVGLGALPNE